MSADPRSGSSSTLHDSWSKRNLEMLVSEERGKPEYPEKNLSEQRREPITNSIHIWRRRRDLKPGNFDEWRVLLPPGGPPLLPTATDKC